MPPKFEHFPVHKKRDEFEDSDSAGKDVSLDKRQAREAKRNGEVIAALPMETQESFDPAAFFETAKQSYIELGKRIQAMGIEPKDVPAWEIADATLDKIKLLSNEYVTERKYGRKKEIAMLMEQLRTSLSGGEVSGQIEDAAREIRNERGEKELEQKKREPPEWKERESFGALVNDTLEKIPDALKQHQYAERLAELASVYGDTTPPEEVVELYRRLDDPKNRAEYLDYVRKAREGAKQTQKEESVVAEKSLVQVETRAEALTANSEWTPKEWHEKMRKLLENPVPTKTLLSPDQTKEEKIFKEFKSV